MTAQLAESQRRKKNFVKISLGCCRSAEDWFRIEATVKKSDDAREGVDRRTFLGALGAAAISSALPGSAEASTTTVPQYLNSYGNVVPAASDLLDAGVAPPPVSSAPLGPAQQVPGYTPPNILMIMVDQMRNPKWFPAGSGGETAFYGQIPNIYSLMQTSTVFSNFFPAATSCSPSRATFLTGLYAPQTCMFQTLGMPGTPPDLQAGFANYTFGAALNSYNYWTSWVGKWHVSYSGGPSVFGFTGVNASGLSCNLPNATVTQSPDGLGNEGTIGDAPNLFPPPASPVPPFFETSAPVGWTTPTEYYDDAAICDWFVDTTLPAAYAQSQRDKSEALVYRRKFRKPA